MIKLSVIIPVYNCEKTVALAIDSILMQVVNFSYEIIIVEDASTDSSYSIIQEYAKKYPFIKIIKHEKNQGNAISFYDALSASKGDYFCVLDGDDYYTVKYKLQKQVDFLDSDTEKEYTAVTHHCLRIDSDGAIHAGNVAVYEEKTYTYKDFLSLKFYYHTSAYMYRNIFRGNVPEVFKQEFFRGDNPRTFMHLNATKGKIKVLDFYGSVYLYGDTGIWSKMSYEDQITRNIKMFQAFSDYCTEKWEKKILSKLIKKFTKMYKKKKPEQKSFTKDAFLLRVDRLANEYHLATINCKKTLYKSLPIDSLCETVGFAAAAERNIIPSKRPESDKNNILIIITDLDLKYKAITSLIENIVKANKGKKISLILTNFEDEASLKEGVKKFLESKDIELLFGSSEKVNKLDILFQNLKKVKPSKTYFFLGRNNSFSAALVQSVYGENICMVPYKRGYCIGMGISSFDYYMTGNSGTYQALSDIFGSKVVFVDNDGIISSDKDPEKFPQKGLRIYEINKKILWNGKSISQKIKDFCSKINNIFLSKK